MLTRLLEPLSTRLERRDRGAAVLHVLLRLVTRDPTTGRDTRGGWSCRRRCATCARCGRSRCSISSRIRPSAAIDRVTIVIDPTPGRVLQHTLFTRAQPTPEQLSTLLARLGALMGQDRFGAPATVDSDRPGAFAMAPFATDHDAEKTAEIAKNAEKTFLSSELRDLRELRAPSPQPPAPCVSALRRCRQPVPARVAVADGRPVRVTTDRRGFAGGAVTHCAGPWRTSGEWWAETVRSEKSEVRSGRSDVRSQF